MTKFTQPQNRENDLTAILEGYEQVLQGSANWLAEAFQKDAIQNSWDAKRFKKGREWRCSLTYSPATKELPVLVIVADSGTYGLTGRIPNTRKDHVDILQKQDRGDRLAFFLSSNWSNKPEDALGTRGRGKMLFLGASVDRVIYFESLRADDNKYVFGKIYLDKESKDVEIEFHLGEEAKARRKRLLGGFMSQTSKPGTRIFILNPQQLLIKAFRESEVLEHLIQQTWWEIIHKHDAKIELYSDSIKKMVEPSPWLPVSKLETEQKGNTGLIEVDKKMDLRIKNISLAYLGEKEIPDAYKGVAIQRGGMTIQRVSTTDLVNDKVGEKIYGDVELEEKFEKKLARNEGPEHCAIHWRRTVPRKLRNVLRQESLSFVHKFSLVGGEEKHVKKIHKEASDEARRELNEVAKALKLQGEGLGRGSRHKKRKLLAEKIRLSIADFETPRSSGRVDYGELVKGVYAVPINETREKFRVFVKARVFNESGDVIKKAEEELVIPSEEPVFVGWEQLKVDDTFLPGKYTFRAEMFAKEDKDLGGGTQFEKGGKIYHPVSRNFYVEEDPPEEEGLFKIVPTDRNDKSRYIWTEPEGNGYILYYNVLHPEIKHIQETEDKDLLREFLVKEGLLFLFSLRLTEDISLSQNGGKPLIFKQEVELLQNGDFEQLFALISGRRSEYLWERS